mmetsp:Transcript_9340/g.15217  ORF Transcript_9340/g.15217 Transcript_9340/m.15217 type:complete len:234 (-) Transcript_9340:2556-3257(-)
MLQTLIVDRTHKYIRLDSLACNSTRQNIFTRVAISVVYKHLRGFDYWITREGSAQPPFPIHHTSFTRDQFDHLTDCHPTREPMRVHNEITRNTLVVKRHIFLVDDEATYTLLAMSRGKFVPKNRHPDVSGQYLDDTRFILIRGEHHLVNVHLTGTFEYEWGRFVETPDIIWVVNGIARVEWHFLIHQDPSTFHLQPNRGNSIMIKAGIPILPECWIDRRRTNSVRGIVTVILL